MKPSSPIDSFSDRKRDLQRKIFHALNINDTEKFVSLESQWVHRYGLETFPGDEKLHALFEDEPVDSEKLISNISLGERQEAISEETEVINNIDQQDQISSHQLSDFEQGVTSLQDKVLNQNQKDHIDSHTRPLEEVNTNQRLKETSDLDDEKLNEQNISNQVNQEASSKDHLLEKDDPESINQTQEKSNEQVEYFSENEEVINIPSPPPPSLNNLRRWLN